MTDDSPEEAMDMPFLITASELRGQQTIRRRKLHFIRPLPKPFAGL